ncbi:MAG: TonB-dependent receptor plug domain-containing protein [Gemmatimonadetes bacterium]|nr:TonB-dependent receptor plug domain-containing protein [Gemmatimonadota bacterium]
MTSRSPAAHVLFAALVALPAAAQQPDSAAKAGAQLPTVTVTGRTGADLFRTPLATTAITPADWRSRLGLGVQDALALVPGVLAQSRSGGPDARITIRGFGSRGAGDRSNAGTTRGIRFLIDGVPETEPDGRTALDEIDLWAASSVEVVRSNASALWGNASGGLVSVSTAPASDAPAFTFRTLMGSYGYQRNMISGNEVMGSGRVYGSVVTTRYDGYRGNAQSERQLVSAGVQAPIGASTDFALSLLGTSSQFNIPGPLSQAQFAADPSQPNATYAGRQERRYNRIVRLGATMDHRFTPADELTTTLFVQPKYLQRSERGTFRDFTRVHAGGSAVYSHTGSWSEGVAHTLSMGADYAFQDGAILFYSLSASNGRGTALRDNKREGASNLGIFVQDRIDAGNWGITLGLRSDNISYDYQNYITPQIDASKSFSGIIPKLGITYALGPRHSVYVNLGGGIEVPAGNETDPAGTFGLDTVTAINPLLEPIRSTTLEVGTKRGFGATRLGPLDLAAFGYDAALYLIDVTNDIVPYRGGRFYFTAGKTRRIGAELSMRARTAWGLGFTGAATVSKSEYLDYLVDSVHYGRPGFFANYSGKMMVGAPRYIGNAQFTYAPPGWSSVSIGAGLQVTGGYVVDDANAVSVPSAGVMNLSVYAGELATFGHFALGGFVSVENLLDRKYVGSAFLNPDIVGGVPLFIEPGMPRTVMVSFQVHRTR